MRERRRLCQKNELAPRVGASWQSTDLYRYSASATCIGDIRFHGRKATQAKSSGADHGRAERAARASVRPMPSPQPLDLPPEIASIAMLVSIVAPTAREQLT
jgi:hypothetical protein